MRRWPPRPDVSAFYSHPDVHLSPVESLAGWDKWLPGIMGTAHKVLTYLRGRGQATWKAGRAIARAVLPIEAMLGSVVQTLNHPLPVAVGPEEQAAAARARLAELGCAFDWSKLLDELAVAVTSESSRDIKGIKALWNHPGDSGLPTKLANEETQITAEKFHELPPSRMKAYRQYTWAQQQEATLKTDREVYDWLQDHVEQDENLPKFSTWSKYLRDARNACETNKHKSRKGRIGRSIVKSDQI